MRLQCEKLQRFKARQVTGLTKCPAELLVLVGQVIAAVCCLGKQLFLAFPRGYLRVHFGMNGTTRVNAPMPPDRDRRLTAEMHFGAVCLRFYDCTLAVATRPLAPLDDRKPLDFCSDVYDAARSFAAVRRADAQCVSDALLDQGQCPGVGNVIKCEALFRACVHPRTPCGDVSEERLRLLLRECRAFTMEWYLSKTRRDVRNTRYIYNQKTCVRCRCALSGVGSQASFIRAILQGGGGLQPGGWV